MPYSDLTKKFENVRDYLGEFYIYGFRKKNEIVLKQDQKEKKRNEENERTSAARTYDDRKWKIKSWLGKTYMQDRDYLEGRVPYISVDSREIVHNPLYTAFKTSTFSQNDILYYFFLLDFMTKDEWLSVREIMTNLRSYMAKIYDAALEVKKEREKRTGKIEAIDHDDKKFEVNEKNVKKILDEYVSVGILRKESGKLHEKRGNVFTLAENSVGLNSWKDAIQFFSEMNQLGVIGSYLLDKMNQIEEMNSSIEEIESKIEKDDSRLSDQKKYQVESFTFYFKHHYLLYALDSEITLNLLLGIREKRYLEVVVWSRKKKKNVFHVVPLKIHVSTQNGRAYLVCYNAEKSDIRLLRVDFMQKVEQKEICDEALYEKIQREYAVRKPYLWGVEVGDPKKTSHVEMTIQIGDDEAYILQRLEREKRNGHVKQISANQYKYVADVFDAMELLPWIRTFTGRIAKLESSNPLLKQKYEEDLEKLYAMYGGGDEDDVS